jgi:hypothetical protein
LLDRVGEATPLVVDAIDIGLPLGWSSTWPQIIYPEREVSNIALLHVRPKLGDKNLHAASPNAPGV